MGVCGQLSLFAEYDWESYDFSIKYLERKDFEMIIISKHETELIRKYFPYVHIRRTTNKYYMEEHKKAMEFLNNYRGYKG